MDLKQLQVIKEVRLTTNQRLALVRMANESGIVDRLDYCVHTDLVFLGLIEKVKLTSEAQIDKEVAAAWKDLAAAVRKKDSSLADKAIRIITGASWRASKEGWRLTDAAKEYLLKGKVLVTVGKSVPGGPVEVKKAS